MEVINVWSRGVSTSWHGCAPPVVTEWSERQDSNGDDGGKNVTTADMFLHNWDTVEVKALNSPLKTTVELWLSP